MIIIDDIKIKDAQKNLGWMLATNSAVSFSYALQGFYMPKNALVSTELHTIAMCISMALCGFGICLLAEMLKLYWAPYLECHKIGRTGKGRYLSGLFKGQDDYDLALAEKDERIPFTSLYGIYTLGSEALGDFNVIGKYAECMWLVQGIIMTVVTKDCWQFVSAIIALVIINLMYEFKEVSFEKGIKMTVPRVLKKSEK